MAEDIAPQAVWDALARDTQAKLVDVRTDMEWAQIGVPDLAQTGKTPALISWQVAPSMQVNPAFLQLLEAAGIGKQDSVYFLCRSGVRSQAAAEAARAAGWTRVFNIADGFEGPPDPSGKRGRLAGWQANGLPWHHPS